MRDDDTRPCRHCRAQALKLEEAMERIRQLEDELKASTYLAPPELGLSMTQMTMLGVLLRYDRVVTPEAMFEATRNHRCRVSEFDGKLIQVHVCKLRQKLRPHGLAIETVVGYGWRLHPDSRYRLLNWRLAEAA